MTARKCDHLGRIDTASASILRGELSKTGCNATWGLTRLLQTDLSDRMTESPLHWSGIAVPLCPLLQGG